MSGFGMFSGGIPSSLRKLIGISSSASEIDGVVNRNKKTIVLLGDSITEDNYPTTVDGYIAYGATGYFTWVQALLNHPFEVVKFAGISGQTSTQILARVDTDVIAYNPAYCMFLCGMNDSGDDTLLKNNILAIYEKLNIAGIHSLILCNTPTVTEATKNLQALKINQWLLSYFKNKKNVTVIDISRVMINPASTIANVLTNITRDERHLSLNGAYQVGSYIASKIKHLVDTDAQYLVKSVADNIYNNPTVSKNYFANALFTTDANSDGLADNVSQTLSNATVTNSLVDSSTGFGKSQKMVISATAGTTTFGYNVVLDFSTNATIYSGEKYYAACIVEIEAGAVNFKNINLAMNIAFNPITYYDMRNVYDITSPLIVPSTGLKFMLMTPVYTASSTVTNFKARSVISFTGVGNATIKISQMSVIKVD